MKLYQHEDGHFWATQAEAKAYKRESGSDFRQVEVPTTEGREALAFFLNDSLRAEFSRAEAVIEARKHDPLSCDYQWPMDDEGKRPMNPDVGDDIDGYPKRRSAYTPVQVETCQLGPRSEHVQDLCYHISKLTGAGLGLVALEVANRFRGMGENIDARPSVSPAQRENGSAAVMGQGDNQ